MRIHYTGQVGGPFGWAVFGANITRELAKLCELSGAADADVIVQPMSDHNLTPSTDARAKANIAVSFFEYPLGPDAVANSQRFDTVFFGSTWCRDMAAAHGVNNGRVLIQGVDDSIFYPRTPCAQDGSFRIFSGGKFEYRKGQDIVIAAFRQFVKRHPEAHLVCSWWNAWPQLIKSMRASEHILIDERGETQDQIYRNMLLANFIHASQFTVLPQLSQRELAEEIALTDCGLFPNRCEGGTNLVLMEYLSCGRPAAANLLTGHADLSGPIEPIAAKVDAMGWADQTIPDVLDAMERLFQSRAAKPAAPRWTWEAAARLILQAAQDAVNS